MNKRTITGLVILMGISLLGIIAVQFYWFNNSVKVRNELFDRSVNEAMNMAVHRLETGHDLKIIRNFENQDSVKWDKEAPYPPPPPPVQELEEMEVMIKKDSINGKITVITSNSRKHNHRNSIIQLKSFLRDSLHRNRRTRNGFAINTDTIVENIDSAFVTGFSLKRANMKMEQLNKLSRQIAIEYRGWETGRHIDENLLKKILAEELINKAIPITFNYSICSEDTVNQKDNRNKGIARLYKVNLFPNDIFRKNLELAISFPERDLFIGRSTSILLGLSAIFSAIIFLTFALSIFLILRQKKISEMKSDFINNMTHEFKTPIATISIAADSILDDKVIGEKERVRFFTGMIKKENHRMNEQVERILQIARLDRKEFEFNFQSVDVHDLIEEAVAGISLQVEKKGGSIVKRLDAPNPCVSTDPIHFINLVYNLLDNANKYSPEEPLIKVTTANTPKGLTLTVEDHGIGMTKAVLSRIFDKFYRLPSGNIHTVKGFGLGLSYVKAILEMNGGNIKVYSEPGKGSRFVVFIPFIMNR